MGNKTQQILSDVVVYNKYAKYIPNLQRRETWSEIVDRYLHMMIRKYGTDDDRDLLDLHIEGVATSLEYSPFIQELIENGQYLYQKKVLPSMRALQFAGPAIEKNEARGYNCSYMPMDDYRAFSELMFLLLGGTGAGYSVQFHHVEKLPEIQKPTKQAKYLIGDSIEGWADAVKQLMKAYFGITKVAPRFDYSDIREKGSMLVTAGGKAPGPEPLKLCLKMIEAILSRKQNGEKLTTFEVHLICCLIADAVLAGGIRRAALIALFSMDDESMISAKSSAIPTRMISQDLVTYTDGEGLKTDSTKMLITVEQNGVIYKDIILHRDEDSKKFWDLEQLTSSGTLGWWVCNPSLGRANNSATILRNRVKKEEFDTLWQMVEESNAGEPGIYFTNDPEYGTNPCCEISLRPFTFCNLTEINAGTIGEVSKADDEDINLLIRTGYADGYFENGGPFSDLLAQADLEDRARVGAFFGTLQAGFTDFHYLRNIWKVNTEKDALIGIGMTGVGDGKIENLDLTVAAKIGMAENARVAKIIGINPAARNTTIKPAGTTSCVVGTASGAHSWHGLKYIRNMQCRVGDDLYNFFTVHHNILIDVMERDQMSAVIGIPQVAPEGAILREEETAIDFLERVKRLNLDWVHIGHRRGPNTNNVSATVSIKKDEWKDVGEWMWKNRHNYNGLSVLPFDGGTYKNAPFETVSDEVFDEKVEYILNNPIDLTLIVEEQDNTTQKDNLACSGGSCEIL